MRYMYSLILFFNCALTYADSLSESRAMQLYGNSQPYKMPAGTKFKFKGWKIPPNSRCSNPKNIGHSNHAKNTIETEMCSICSDSISSRARVFSGPFVINGQPDNVDEAGNTGRIQFEFANFNFRCEFADHEQTLSDMVHEFKKIGITLSFPQPVNGSKTNAQPPNGAFGETSY